MWKPKDKALMLRTCNSSMQGYNEFQWPRAGVVQAKDWEPTRSCGRGLHGLLWGEGNSAYLSDQPDAVWLVCEIDLAECVDLWDKVKVPRCNVLYAGDKGAAVAWIAARAPRDTAPVFACRSYGDNDIALVGAHGMAVVGDWGVAVAGCNGVACAGAYGMATVGVGGTVKAGIGGRIASYWYAKGGREKIVADVDGSNLFSDVWYTVKDGSFVPA